MIKGIIGLYKIILVRNYDEIKDELFYTIHTSGRRTQFKKNQVIAEALVKKTNKSTAQIVDITKLTVGDIVYVNEFGWVEVVK